MLRWVILAAALVAPLAGCAPTPPSDQGGVASAGQRPAPLEPAHAHFPAGGR